MAAEANHWKLGLFVVTGLLVAAGGVVWLGQQQLQREVTDFMTYFDESVQGLEIGSAVKFRGVTIGSVKEITIARDQRLVEVRCEVDVDKLDRLGLRAEEGDPAAREGGGEAFVPPEVRTQLAQSGITGQKFILIDYFDPAEYPIEEPDFPTSYRTIPATRSTIDDLLSSLNAILKRLPQVADQVSGLITRLDETVGELDAAGLSDRAQTLMETADGKLNELDVKRLDEELDTVLTTADATLQAMRELTGKVSADDGEVFTLVRRIDAAATALEEAISAAKLGDTTASLRNTSESFGSVARELGGSADELQASLEALRQASVAVRNLAELLERDPSSLLQGTDPPEPPPVGGRR